LNAADRILAVWRRNFMVWRKLAVVSLIGNFGDPFLYLLGLGYGLGLYIGTMGGIPYMAFLASGILCSSAMNTATFEGLYSAFTRMSQQYTWEGMMAAPLGISDIVAGEILWAATKSLISCTAILIVAMLLGGVQTPETAWLALPVVFLTGLCFAAIALVVCALAPSYDFFIYYFTLLVTPMFLAGAAADPCRGADAPAAHHAAADLRVAAPGRARRLCRGRFRAGGAPGRPAPLALMPGRR